MEWKSYGRRRVYDSPYVEVWLDDVDIPGVGRIDHHVVAAAIAREIEEETGWRPGRVVPLTEYDALAGISTMRFRCFHATGCEQVGAPVDASEAARVEWLPEPEVVKLLTAGEVPDGPSLAALSYYLGPHRLAAP